MTACQRSPPVLVVKSTTESRAPISHPTITAGDAFPNIDVSFHQGDGTLLNRRERFSRNSAVIFAVPGAFTPTCSERHYPGFLQLTTEIKHYVSEIICLSVNDPFVLGAWQAGMSTPQKHGITLLADPEGMLVSTLGLSQDLKAKGLGIRAQRFAMVVGRGVVQWIGINVNSFVEQVLEILRSMSFSTFDIERCVAEAKVVLSRSHAPYTKGGVSACGVAIQTDRGVIVGCTVENCAYPNSVCGVKAALVNALSEGTTRIDGLAIIGNNISKYPYICGLCREFIAEKGVDNGVSIPDLISNVTPDSIDFVIRSVSELLPERTCSLNPLPNRVPEVPEELLAEYSLDPSLTNRTSPELKELYQSAIKACNMTYTPVSHFPVGAAVLTDAGTFTGSNIEHNIIGLGLCAERTALCKAVAGGATQIKKLALVCYKMEAYGSPCGGCRQSLVEFENFPVYLLRMNHEKSTFTEEMGQK